MSQRSFAGQPSLVDKQNGTTRLQGTRCKQLIKGRRQEKKSSECLQEVWGTARAVRGGDIQTLYTLRRQEGGYVGNAVNHISSPYHRREDGAALHHVCWSDLLLLSSR